MTSNTLKVKLLQLLKAQLVEFDPSQMELVASGRTSIDFAIKDIKATKPNARKALLPDYLCDSMITPFEKNNVLHDFYSVKFENGKFMVDLNKISSSDYDILLICDYFYHNKELYKGIANAKNQNATIIHDTTHTLFSKDTTFSDDDYVVCSLRKWFVTTDGGLIIKNGIFGIERKNEHEEYIYYKTKSREYKELYYKENTDDIKQKYKQYSDLAEKCLDNNFSLYGMSKESQEKILSINIDEELKKRKKYFNLINEKITLTDGIRSLNGITEDNCMFTLPVLIDSDRDKVLDVFYDNLIRCAVLWEPTEKNECVDDEFISKSICLDITEDTNLKIDKVLKKIKGKR